VYSYGCAMMVSRWLCSWMCAGGVEVVVCSLCVLDSLFVCVVRTSPWSLLAVKMVTELLHNSNTCVSTHKL
jgi:hypothetical protein